MLLLKIRVVVLCGKIMIIELRKLISHLQRFKQEIKKRKVNIKLFRFSNLLEEDPNSSVEDIFKNKEKEINKIKEDSKIDKTNNYDEELKERIKKASSLLEDIRKNE